MLDINEFAQSWLNAWNAHDVESVLKHFDKNVVFSSPVAKQLLKNSDGIIRGKEALRQYWTEGLRRIPDLHFELLAVYSGVNCIVLNYRNQKGGLVCEVLVLDGVLVIAGYGTYLDNNNNLAGASR
jgi:hypothetical protein